MEQEEMSFWMVEALKDNVARIWMAGGKGRHDRDSVSLWSLGALEHYSVQASAGLSQSQS